ncbi:hypothetical protein MRX96_048280 [Rhipicephalus microplus]
MDCLRQASEILKLMRNRIALCLQEYLVTVATLYLSQLVKVLLLEPRLLKGDSASMQNRKVEFAHNGGNRNTSAGNAAFNNDHGASQNNSMVHAGLMNIEPIPIERPDFIAIGDSNDTNVTTAEDWAALSSHGKEYEDIIPEKERGIFQSRLNLNHNNSFLKEDALSGNLSASVPTPKRNETQSFEPEVMDLTPPRGLTSASKREFTRSRSALSRPGSAKPAPLATDRTTDEIDNVDDARNQRRKLLAD